MGTESTGGAAPGGTRSADRRGSRGRDGRIHPVGIGLEVRVDRKGHGAHAELRAGGARGPVEAAVVVARFPVVGPEPGRLR